VPQLNQHVVVLYGRVEIAVNQCHKANPRIYLAVGTAAVVNHYWLTAIAQATSPSPR
jgi:hypothetical protein